MSNGGYSSKYKPQERAYYTRARTAIIKNMIELCCVKCGTYDQIEVHHIDLDITNNSINNLQPLCKRCHYNLHNGIAV